MPVFTLDAADPDREQVERFGIWNVKMPEVPLAPARHPPVPVVLSGRDTYGIPPDDFADRGGGDQKEEQVWQIRLPSDPVEAMASLTAYQQAQELSYQAFSDIEQRIDTLARRAQETRKEAPQVLGASPPPDTPMTLDQLRALRETADAPEAWLLDEFIRIHQEEGEGGETTDRGRAEVLGPGPETPPPPEVLGPAKAPSAPVSHPSLPQMLNQMIESLTTYARVETVLGDQRIAYTVIGWLGDVKTVWKYADANNGETWVMYKDLHQQSLKLALESRDAMVRSIVMAVGGAAKLWFLCSTPTGAIFAIPTLWSYIRRILSSKPG